MAASVGLRDIQWSSGCGWALGGRLDLGTIGWALGSLVALGLLLGFGRTIGFWVIFALEGRLHWWIPLCFAWSRWSGVGFLYFRFLLWDVLGHLGVAG